MSAFDLCLRYKSKEETIVAFAQAARHELALWAETTKPSLKSDNMLAQMLCMAVWMMRGMGFGTHWGTGRGYWSTWAKLGGETRINMLITIARFDKDGDGNISSQEMADYHKFGEALVANTVGAYQNLGIVFTLLIGATHQTVISRPGAWAVSSYFQDVFGDGEGEPLLVVAYTVNALLEILCIATLCSCIFLRLLLTNTLTSLDAKIACMVSTNSLATTATTSIYAVMLLVVLMAVGGVLGQPRWGFIVVGFVPLFFVLMLRRIARFYCECISRQHDEAIELTRKAQAGPTDASPAAARARVGPQAAVAVEGAATLELVSATIQHDD